MHYNHSLHPGHQPQGRGEAWAIVFVQALIATTHLGARGDVPDYGLAAAHTGEARRVVTEEHRAHGAGVVAELAEHLSRLQVVDHYSPHHCADRHLEQEERGVQSADE